MKRLMMTAAALALLTTTANAGAPIPGASITAKVLGLSFVYDEQCEKIPRFKENAMVVLRYLIDTDAIAGLREARAEQIRQGAAFCAYYKPTVEKANPSGPTS